MTLHAADTAADVVAEGVTGRVGIGRHDPAGDALFGDLNWSGAADTSGFDFGDLVECSNVLLNGGRHYVRGEDGTTITLVAAINAVVDIEGHNYTVTTLTARGASAVVTDRRTKAVGNVATTYQVEDGASIDMRGLSQSRNVGTLELTNGSIIKDTSSTWTTLTLKSPVKVTVEPYTPD